MRGTPQPVRVLLVDDEPMFLEALKALLEADERVSVVRCRGQRARRRRARAEGAA